MTGHNGLIGSFLLKELISRGDKPVLLFDKREGHNIIDINAHKVSERVDVFIHLASFCKINQTISNPKNAFENNVLGMFEVLEFCRLNKIPKIVFTSSSRVLSKEKNPYTASKLFGEELVKSYSQCYGIDYVIIRPSTVYGPFNDLTKRLIDVYILNALLGKDLEIYGDEYKTLDFTYIDDFIQGFLIAMGQNNKEFNIANGKGISLSYVADLIIGLASNGNKLFSAPEIAQPQEVEVDISSLSALGYRPCVNIEAGLKRTFDWYKEHLHEIIDVRE